MPFENDVHLVSHPLVQHKLSLMRETDRSTKGFRELLNEILRPMMPAPQAGKEPAQP